MPGPTSARYQVLLVAQIRLAAAVAQSAPESVIQSLHHELQTAFEALCVQLGPEPGDPIPARRPGVGFRRTDRLVRPLAPPAPRLETVVDCAWERRTPPDEAARPSGCAFAGEDRLLVGFGYTL